jgi:hypothetical protein
MEAVLIFAAANSAVGDEGFLFNLAPVGIWQRPLFRLGLSIFVAIILLDNDGGQWVNTML